MKKKILALAMAAIMLLGVFVLTGCGKSKWPIYSQSDVYAFLSGYESEKPERQTFMMKAGDTHALNIEQFKDFGINYAKYEVINSNSNVITIENDILTAVDNGFAIIRLNFYIKGSEKYGSKSYTLKRVRYANIFVINESTMTEVTTAQELADISNNLDGNYILKADIDLADVDWQPLGGVWFEEMFNGIFINPYGFVIRNLRTSPSKTLDNNGLFGSINRALIDGVIMENVFIDVSEQLGSIAGGIVRQSIDSLVINCKVSGKIYANHFVGGLTALSSNGVFINCEFNGIVEASGAGHSGLYEGNVCAGGIVGYYYGYSYDNNTSHLANEGIYDCKVDANIISTGYTGGMYGYNVGNSRPINCAFTGSVFGEKGYGEMYGYCRWDEFE